MIHLVDNISSTNVWLSKYHYDIDDTLLAMEQINGKGRRGNSWESKKGGLYFSTVSSNHELLPFLVGISIMKVLDKHCEGLSLKWPNDIILKDNKLGGILCENFGNYSVVGVGINFANSPAIEKSTSLLSHGLEFDKSVFLASFLFHFDLSSSLESEEIVNEFEKFNYLYGKKIFWDDKSGVAQSLASDGSLIVASEGKELNLYSEEVHLERY